MTTVYLHIGTMKTGTSALQSFLDENREVLETQGYCYPKLRLGLKRNYFLRNANFLIWRSEKEGEEGIAEEKALRDNAFALLEDLAKQYDNIILSDELIWHHCNYLKNFWPNLVERFQAINCEVKVIVYLRRQDLVIQSLWKQFVKLGQRTAKDFMECVNTNVLGFFPLDYYRHLKKIAKYVKKENLIVRVYEKGQFEGEMKSIQSDFLKSIHLDWSKEYLTKDGLVNDSLEGNYIEIKRLINGIPEYREMDDFMVKPIMRASSYQAKMEAPPKTSLFSYEDQEAFLKSYEESNRKVAAEFLGRKDAPLFFETVQEAPVWKIEPETMYRDLVISVSEIFCEQEKKIIKLQEEVENLKQIRQMQIQLQRDVMTMYNSLIFRIYRKIRKILKHK